MLKTKTAKIKCSERDSTQFSSASNASHLVESYMPGTTYLMKVELVLCPHIH